MKKYMHVVVVSLLAVLFVAACTQQPAAEEPEIDLGMVKTQAVQTAVSQMTADAEEAAQAEPAEELPTITPLPTKDTSEAMTVPTITPATSGGSGGGGTSGTPIPTWTPVVYGCQVVDQNPLDGNQYVGADVDVYWTLKNVGAATWTAGTYYYHWTGYSDLSPTHSFTLSTDVGPYETVQVMIDVKVPITPGQYRTQWYLVNDNGQDFCGFYYYVNAIPFPTATP